MGPRWTAVQNLLHVVINLKHTPPPPTSQPPLPFFYKQGWGEILCASDSELKPIMFHGQIAWHKPVRSRSETPKTCLWWCNQMLASNMLTVGQFVMYNVQCMYNAEYRTMYIQCTVQCTMYHVQCTMYNVQCTMYNVQCTMYTV